MNTVNLDSFHNKWLGGFSFCQKAYSLFNQIQREDNGSERLSMRTSDLEKKLIEEILPIAKFVQIKTRPGNELKIKWMYGNQKFDAYFKQFGLYVENGFSIPKGHLEVTGVYHPKHYLARELSNKKEIFFGYDGLIRDKTTKNIHSSPNVRVNLEFVEEMAKAAIDQIKKKSEKSYPDNTTLVVECNLNIPYYDYEWHHFLCSVSENCQSHSFKEILLYCDGLLGQYAAFHKI